MEEQNISDKPAIIIIDMLNEYLDPAGKVYCENCREIIPNTQTLIEFAHKKGFPVIYLNTSLPSEDEPMVKKWGLHAVKGTWGAENIPELSPLKHDVIVNKTGYDGFYASKLEVTLRELGVNKIVLAGIHTHVCVLFTGVGGFERGFDVIALEDCMTTGFKPNHENRLRFYNTHIGELMTLNEFTRRYQ